MSFRVLSAVVKLGVPSLGSWLLLSRRRVIASDGKETSNTSESSSRFSNLKTTIRTKGNFHIDDWRYQYLEPMKRSGRYRIPNKDDRVVIIGAGPAGIHMNLLLKERGYNNVTILERTNRVGGKAFTNFTDDGTIPQEMGACYTVPNKYIELRRIAKNNPKFKEIFVPPRTFYLDYNRMDVSKRVSQDEYILTHLRSGHSKFNLWKHLPDLICKGRILIDVVRYIFVYKNTFKTDDYQHTLNFVKDLTFEEWLVKNKLSNLIPLFRLTQVGQGYGYINKIPAYYGLKWNNPPLMYGFIQSGLNPLLQPASLLKCGFHQVFEYIVETNNFDVRKNCIITDINRNLYSKDGNIMINCYFNGDKNSEETLEADWLVIATNLSMCKEFLKDATEEESEIFDAINQYSHLVTTLYSCDDLSCERDGRTSIKTWTPALVHDNYGRLMTIRDTKRIIDGTDGRVENWVGYQYDDRMESWMNDENGDATPKFKAELLDKLTHDLTQVGFTNIKVIDQRPWPYFFHFNNDGIKAEYPFRIDLLQGKYKTWYNGASTVFESVNDVLNHNLAIVDYIDHANGTEER